MQGHRNVSKGVLGDTASSHPDQVTSTCMPPKIHAQGLVHMTGGGFPENIPRVVPKGLATRVSRGSWEVPALFQWLQEVRMGRGGVCVCVWKATVGNPAVCPCLAGYVWGAMEPRLLICASLWPALGWARVPLPSSPMSPLRPGLQLHVLPHAPHSNVSLLPPPPQAGKVADEEMFRTFNMGVGMVIVVAPKDVDAVLQTLPQAWVMGEIVEGSGVEFTD